MKVLSSLLAVSLGASLGLSACVDEADLYEGETVKSEDGKADSSAVAVFLDAEWDGKLITDSSFNDLSTIQSQLFYTVGHLNGSNAVGRIDKAQISNIVKTTVGGRTQITYRAKLLVAWGNRTSVPSTYQLSLPLDISASGQNTFATKYGTTCVDGSAHDVDAGTMFYYYRPRAFGCSITPSDLYTTTVTFSPSPVQTTGRFPEYDKIWEDNALNVVAIFGKNEDGATSGDVGIDAYNRFVAAMKSELANRGLTTIPASVPSNPGVAAPDIELHATLPGGKTIKVVALLTDNVRVGLSQTAFRTRYENLSTRADYIVYNGHAGLGTNVRAMAAAGRWVQGQYVVVQLNGCDTFAYIDDALNRAHKAVNPDDTTGSKYIDLVNNAMPAFFHELSNTTMAMFRGLVAHESPKTFEQIFAPIDRAQVVLVSGEQDNTFTPGGGGNPQPWAGMNETASVARNAQRSWSTPILAPGTYEFAMTGTQDADLYVRIGSAPTTGTYDCRPFKSGSNETCSVTLSAPAKIFTMVRGFSSAVSNVTVRGRKI